MSQDIQTTEKKEVRVWSTKEETNLPFLRGIINSENIKKEFESLSGSDQRTLLVSALSIVSSNKLLQKADPQSILVALRTAASLRLAINPSLGRAYIIPYGDQVQFQVGYKGFVELALRTSQYLKINAVQIYEGQFIESEADPLKEEFHFNFKAKKSDKIIGYAAYFKLLNGFEKICFMKDEDVQAHGKRFSKTFHNGPWKTDNLMMCLKTVLKGTIGKYGPLSVEMEKAIELDQTVDGEYADIPLYISETSAPVPASIASTMTAEAKDKAVDAVVTSDKKTDDMTTAELAERAKRKIASIPQPDTEY